ncbi:exo-alpha-sialidase [Roseovarius sp. A-2]|uniref:exo-alpha-sialidase n=1 Tax=Roseovarius sp. A-2 TaxID=1570360 RepID=UPI001C382D8F|nr:exo-alpha-sialidase [Roseovarius sp. A-2]
MPLVILALAALSLCMSAVAMRRAAPLKWRFALPAPLPVAGPARFETVFEYQVPEGEAHAPAIVLRAEGFDVLWFQGSKEAAADVDIHGVEIRQDGSGWRASPPGPVLTRAGLEAAFEPMQRVVTLGNTIENEARAGHLYTTAVSLGGWAMAAIADVEIGPDGPLRARKLNLSPLLNRSFLVKSPMLAYEGGSTALPAYFEMGWSHGVLIRLDAAGRVRDRRRLRAPGARLIQPMIVPLDARRAVAFLRDLGGSGVLWRSVTEDGGQSWKEPVPTDRANANAPVAALWLGTGRIVMAANDDADAPGDLVLSLSEDEGRTWRVLHRFERPGARRYPMLRRVGDSVALTYSTGTKRGIAVHLFNAAWLAGQ